MKFSKQDWQISALYRMGHKRNLGRDTIIAILRDRIGLDGEKAHQLTSLWMQTRLYRAA